jgi:phenylpropionate dioxygenase-like ring-hydroxylating dioxygenase large terminal subunit
MSFLPCANGSEGDCAAPRRRPLRRAQNGVFRPAPMSLTPTLASQLERIRSQARTGRLEWRESSAAVAHIPVENYASPAVRDAEIERLFRPLPLIAGHASELAPGQVLASDEYGVPMLLTRDADGSFRAFLNVCRHRGMRLVEDTGAAQSRASVVCPYHGWTYKLDGALRHRLHAEAFDCNGGGASENLVPLPCEERHGLLWVVPTPGATIDVAAHLGGLDAQMPFFAVEGLTHFRSVWAEYPANWKLIVDAFLEAYHIRVLHKDTIYPFFADGNTAGERFGPHIQSLVTRRAGETWAKEHGTPGSALPEGMPGLCELVTPSHVIFPNTITIFHPDYLSLVTLYPVAAGTLRWTHRMLIPKDRASADWTPHWEKTFRLIEEGVFQKEDIACAIGIQKGLASGANRFLTAGRAEQAIGWFHEDIAKRLTPR